MDLTPTVRARPASGPRSGRPARTEHRAQLRQAAATALQVRGVFRLVLVGGSTPRPLYEALRHEPTDWSRWDLWFGDERCLPPDHPDRNSRMVELAWLAHVPLPPARLHRIPAELGPVTGALAYARELAPIEEFDLVLLGLGTDGHTASLFPGQPWGETREAPAALPVHHALFPPAERVSLSAWRLCAARQVVFLVTGSDKADALERWQAGEPLPAAALRPPGGVDVWIG